MAKKDLFGIGPKFVLISLLYTAIIFAVYKKFFPGLKFVIINKTISLITGSTLILIGLTIFFISVFMVAKLSKNDRLYTKSVYSIMRHPMYGSWILYTVPGIIIISGSLPGLSVPVIMYIAFRLLIKDEEKKLLMQYGKEYEQYKKRVGLLFPKLFSNKQIS